MTFTPVRFGSSFDEVKWRKTWLPLVLYSVALPAGCGATQAPTEVHSEQVGGANQLARTPFLGGYVVGGPFEAGPGWECPFEFQCRRPTEVGGLPGFIMVSTCNGVVYSSQFIMAFTPSANPIPIEVGWSPLPSFRLDDYEKRTRKMADALRAAGWVEGASIPAGDVGSSSEISETAWARGAESLIVRHGKVSEGKQVAVAMYVIRTPDPATPCTQGLE
jgi:hypothetical protein